MIRWGFIGCGEVVQKKSGRPFWWEGHSTVSAVMCRNLERGQAYAKANNIPICVTNAQELIENPSVDAVYIATPPNSHMEYAKMAINAGKPVYVEKPMGTLLSDCESVFRLSEEKNVPIFVAFYRRSLEYYQILKKMLYDDQVIGAIRGVNVLHYAPPRTDDGWKQNPELSGGGLFYDASCHTLDTLDFLFGPVELAQGDSRNMRKLTGTKDSISCQFTFESGLMGTGLWCFDSGTKLEQVQVVGDKGELRFHIHNDWLRWTVDGQAFERQIVHPEFIQEPMVRNVISALEGKETAHSTGESALRTARIQDKIYYNGKE